MRRPGIIMIVVCALLGVTLMGSYLLMGGGRYTPMASANPCDPRPWRDPQTNSEIAEQVALSSLDGAACELGVSREDLTLALASEKDLERFRESHGLSDDKMQEVLRQGLRRAVRDGRQAGALNAVEGFLLERLIGTLPLRTLLNAYMSGDLAWMERFIR